MAGWLQGLSAAGNFLSGAGSIASALGLGSKDKGPDVPSLETQRDEQVRYNRDNLKVMVQTAKELGIHPLAVLGQTAPGGMAAVGTNPGAAFSAAGRGLEEAIAGIKANELYEQQLTRAKVDVANARIAGNNAAIAGARDMWTLEAMQTYLRDHPGAAPPGVQPYSLGMLS